MSGSYGSLFPPQGAFMCSLFRRFLCAMALSVGMVPLLVAQPQVLSPDQSAVTVGAADTISFSNGDITIHIYYSDSQLG